MCPYSVAHVASARARSISIVIVVVLLAAGVRGDQATARQPADTLLRSATRLIAHGKYGEAETQARARAANDPDAAAVLGRLAVAHGQYDAAARILQPVAATQPTSQAALDFGLLLMTRGRKDEARRVLAPMAASGDTARSPDALLRAARAARALRQRQIAYNFFDRANEALAGDPEINTEWGELLVEAHQPGDAEVVFRAALKSDADWAPALAGLAQALDDLGATEAPAAARRALEIDPQLVAAHLFTAGAALDADRRPEARAAIDHALAINPNSLPAHALLAGLDYVDGKTAEYEAEVAKALAINPVYGDAYRVAANQAAASNRFDEAVTLSRQAVALEPDNIAAQADLGMQLLRLGEEGEARRVLDLAFNADRTNTVTFNLLGLLDRLATFRSFQVGSNIVRLDATEAPVLQDYAGPIVEQALAKFGARYQFTPRGPLVIEVFSRHDDFAVRALGIPGLLGALGACFGRVVTLDSPRARVPGTFNWQATLWHEMAHVYTLQLSNFRVPRWLTEGISVWEEGQVRPEWANDSELGFARAYIDGRLPKLKDFNSAFTSPQTVALAYFQASLVVDLFVTRFGDAGLRKLLVAYGEGLDTDAALKKAAGIALADLQSSLDALVEKRFGAIGRALEMPKGFGPPKDADVTTLRAEAAKYPGSYPVQMIVGQALAAADARDQAFAAYERAAALVPTAPGADSPHARMADLALKNGDSRRAMAELKALVQYDHTNVDAARALVPLAEKAGDEAARALAYERIVTADPFDPAAHSGLAKIAIKRPDLPLAIREFQAAVAAGPVDVVPAYCDLAEALLVAGRRDEAKKQVLEALKIAPSYERGQSLLLKIIEGR